MGAVPHNNDLCTVVIIAIDDVEEDLEEVSGTDEYENIGDYRSAAGWMVYSWQSWT